MKHFDFIDTHCSMHTLSGNVDVDVASSTQMTEASEASGATEDESYSKCVTCTFNKHMCR